MAVANAAMVFVKRVMAVSLSNGAGRVGAGRSGIERRTDHIAATKRPSRTGESGAAMSATISTSASSSGDLRADRRFLYAEKSAATGDHSAAAELLEQLLEIVPYWAPWFALGVAREKLGDADAAQQAYARALACDPQDVLGASLARARLGAAPVPASATPAYVVRLIDQYARRFDAHLVEGLGYRAPALLRDAVADVRRRMARPMHFARALDLGCGTGLAGAAFRDCVDRLEGLDLSAAMIAEAREGHL